MIDKLHLWLNNNYEKIKHWLLIGVAVMLMVFSMFTIAGQNRLLKQSAVQTEKISQQGEEIKRLSEENKKLNEQAKRLGEENKSINKQSRSFVLCGFQVFAKFTRDYQPIENLDLESCTTDSQSQATNETPTAGTSAGTSQGNSNPSSAQTSTVSSSQNTTTPPNGQSNTSQPDNDGIIIDLPLLPKIHIGSPF